MSKFSEWLSAERGRSSALTSYLGTHRNVMSRVKLGKCKMPSRWVPHIVDFSKGDLSYEDLLPKAALRSRA